MLRLIRTNIFFILVLLLVFNRTSCLEKTRYVVQTIVRNLNSVAQRPISTTAKEAYKRFNLNPNFKFRSSDVNKIFSKISNLNIQKDELEKFKKAKEFIIKHQRFIENYYDFNNLSKEDCEIIITQIKNKLKANEQEFENETVNAHYLEALLDPAKNKKAHENFLKFKILSLIPFLRENLELISKELGLFALYHAIIENDFETVEFLLKNGASPNTIIKLTSVHKLPVYFMISSIEMFSLIHKYGIDISLNGQYCSNKFSVLHHIIRPEYTKDLINAYLPLFDEIPTDSFGDTPWDILNYYSNQAPVEKMELYLKNAQKHWPNDFPVIDIE